MVDITGAEIVGVVAGVDDNEGAGVLCVTGVDVDVGGATDEEDDGAGAEEGVGDGVEDVELGCGIIVLDGDTPETDEDRVEVDDCDTVELDDTLSEG